MRSWTNQHKDLFYIRIQSALVTCGIVEIVGIVRIVRFYEYDINLVAFFFAIKLSKIL